MKRILLTVDENGIVSAILYYLIQSGRLNFERLLLLMIRQLMMMYLIPIPPWSRWQLCVGGFCFAPSV